MIKITDNAGRFLQKEKNNNKNIDLIIYISVIYPFGHDANVSIVFCKNTDLNIDDIKVQTKYIDIYIENKSKNVLTNAVIDIKNEQLLIKAPNLFKQKDINIKEKIKNLFENEINVFLSQHGGFIQLVDILNNDTLIIKFHGGCQGCGMVGFTLNNFIERTIKKNFPQIKNILDVTQHEIKDQSYY